MNRFLNLIVTTIIALTAAAVSAQNIDYKVTVQDFTELTIVDGINVYYQCSADSAGYACFSCEPSQASHIIFDNRGNHLFIQTDAYETAIKGLPSVKIYSSSLHKAINSGDSLLCIINPAPVATFKAQQIGNGTLEILNIEAGTIEAGNMTGHGRLHLTGKATKAIINSIGTGPIDATSLEADEIKCYMLGTGDIDCAPTESLRIFGAGKGAVRYHKSPAKITNLGIGVAVKNESE